MPSAAFAVYERLRRQVEDVRDAAVREEATGQKTGPNLLRACIVLMVAAFDTYMHEQGVSILHKVACSGNAQAGAVSKYLKNVSAPDLVGPTGEALIRFRLSYRTLVSPEKIDELLEVADRDPKEIWLKVSLALGSRPDRLRLQTKLQYDRRNQIAHEGDWDVIAFDFRTIHEAHVADCMTCLDGLVSQLDLVLV